MKVTSDKEEMVFRFEKDNKVAYTIGVAKKNDKGEYDKDYWPVKFRKNIDIPNRTKIKIKNGWPDFYFYTLDDKQKTYRYFFIDEFEIVNQEQPKEEPKPEPKKDGWVSAKEIDIDDEELPFF